MKPPICKLCKSPHWTYEEHKPTDALEEVRQVGADVLGYEKRFFTFPDSNPPETVTTVTDVPTTVYVPTDVPTCACGKPREGQYKKCAACRKRAYRERSTK